MDEITLYAFASLIVCTITAIVLFIFDQKFRLWEILMLMNKTTWEKRLRSNPEKWAYYQRLTDFSPSLHYDSNSRLLRGIHKGCMYLMEGLSLFMGIMLFFAYFSVQDAPRNRLDEAPWAFLAFAIGWSLFIFGFMLWTMRFGAKRALIRKEEDE